MGYKNDRIYELNLFWLFYGFHWVVTSIGPGGLMVCVCIIWREHPKAKPKVVLEEPGIEPATPGLQDLALIHYTTTASLCA